MLSLHKSWERIMFRIFMVKFNSVSTFTHTQTRTLTDKHLFYSNRSGWWSGSTSQMSDHVVESTEQRVVSTFAINASSILATPATHVHPTDVTERRSLPCQWARADYPLPCSPESHSSRFLCQLLFFFFRQKKFITDRIAVARVVFTLAGTSATSF